MNFPLETLLWIDRAGKDEFAGKAVLTRVMAVAYLVFVVGVMVVAVFFGNELRKVLQCMERLEEQRKKKRDA